jgi:hypothetical protein
MSRNDRRYEAALAALKAIARTMGNVVFRVEDYCPPRSCIEQRDAQENKRRGKADHPSSIARRTNRS